MNKPSIAELLNKSGIFNFTPDLVRRAIDSLYGNIGAGTDERNWDAIMGAANPLLASETALVAMIQDPGFLQRNAGQLIGMGYAASQAELTYRQLHERLNLNYTPGWAVGTAYENLGSLSTADLLSRVQTDVASMKPVEIEKPVVKNDPAPATSTPDAAPTITLVPGNSGLGVTLNVAANLALSVGGALGSFTAGTSVLADQASVKSGTLQATGNAGLTSSATSQTIALGTAGNDTINTSSAGTQVDVIAGGAGNDTINAGAGDDILMGGAGNDLLTGGTGTDTLYGGDGDDLFEFTALSDLFASNALVDSIDGGAGTNAITLNNSASGFQITAAYSWASRITNVSKIQVSGSTAALLNITLNDGAYEAGIRIVDLSGDTTGTGNVVNIIDVSAETGSANGYKLTGHIASDSITGGAGNDTIFGGTNADTLNGGGGDDYFYYINQSSFFFSGSILDSIDGGSGTNAIVFDSTNTSFTINTSDSWASRITNVSKIMLSGPTTGQIQIQLNNNAYEAGLRTIDLSADTETATSSHLVTALSETGTSNGYLIIGHNGADSMVGGAGPDTINGGGGADTLVGNGGNDTISGGAGNDLVFGGTGNDTLSAGSGADILVLSSTAAQNGLDLFTDVEAGAGGDLWRLTNMLGSSGAYATTVTTAATGDVNITGKVAVLRGTESAVDEEAEIAAFINGAGNAFALSAGGKAVIFTGSATVVVNGSGDLGRIFFVIDTNSDGVVDASEVGLVGLTQADFDVGNLVAGNFDFN